MSRAYQKWQTIRAAELDEIRNVHAAIGGPKPGRRYATQQLNHAYLVLLAAQFQGFCRDLHSECVDHLFSVISPPATLQSVLRASFTRNRQLDRGNANPGSLGGDFDRLALKLWGALELHHPRVLDWKKSLELLNEWRNAVAHQDFTAIQLHGTMKVGLARINQWRRHCSSLAKAMDRVLNEHLLNLTSVTPW